METKHPIYDTVVWNIWIIAFVSRSQCMIQTPFYEIMFMNEEPYCKIRNKINCRELSLSSKCVRVNGSTYSILNCMLSSAFPHIRTNETVVHIDDNPHNNCILNLQWMSRTECSIKGQQRSTENSNVVGGRNGKHIIVKYKDTVIGIFRSIHTVARYIKDSLKKNISDKSLESKISRSLKINSYTVYGFHFEEHITIIDSEVWKTIHIDGKEYEVSTHGRIKNSLNNYLVYILFVLIQNIHKLV